MSFSYMKDFTDNFKKLVILPCNYPSLHHFISTCRKVLIQHYLPQEPSQTQRYSTLYFSGWCNCKMENKEGVGKKKKVTVIYQSLHSKTAESILAASSWPQITLIATQLPPGVYGREFTFLTVLTAWQIQESEDRQALTEPLQYTLTHCTGKKETKSCS